MPDYMARSAGIEDDPYVNRDGSFKPVKMEDATSFTTWKEGDEITEPGIYLNVPFADYLAIKAMSNSALSRANESLRHYHRARSIEPTKQMNLGSLCHCGQLEPLAIAQRYAVVPAFENDAENVTAKGDKPSSPKATGYYKDKVREFTAANRDKEIIDEAEYQKMLDIVASLAENERAAEWFGTPGYTEATLVWECPDTGMLCKARADHLTADFRRITDLKTTAEAKKFNNSVADFGYHRQAAHYSQGVEVLTGVATEFCIVAIETTPPYCCRSAPMHEESLAAGRSEVLKLKRDIQDAMEEGEWPGYSDPEAWMLPAWYETSQAEPISLIVNGQTLEV